MSYRIEITADSLTELSGKLLALAAQMQVSAPAVGAVEEKPKAARKPAKTEDKPVEAKAEDAPATEPEQKAAGNLPPEKVPLPEGTVAKVVEVVEAKGRAVIEGVLSQFGVAKASQVPVDQRGELLAALEAALAETE